MAFSGILTVTDGTPEYTVSFIATSKGVILKDWNPQTNIAKITWSEPVYADGRKPVMSTWANAIETFESDIADGDMDGVIEPFRKVIDLFKRAVDYWKSDYQIGDGPEVHPIWLIARGTCETETRYAYIYNGDIPQLSNPHDLPFIGDPSSNGMQAAIESLTITIERGLWRDTAPGSVSCLKTYSYQVMPGWTSGVFYPGSGDDTVSVDGAGGGGVLTPNDLEHQSQDVLNLGIRYRNLNIPQGATILAAYCIYESNYNTLPGDLFPNTYSLIEGFDEDNTAAFSTWANFYARAVTAANFDHIAWETGTTAGQYLTYLNLNTIVQEIVNRPGWASGNAMGFKITHNDPFGPPAFMVREFGAYNTPGFDMPALYVIWEDPEVAFGVDTPVCERSFAAGYFVNNQPDYMAYYDASTAVYTPSIVSPQPQNLFPQPLGVGDRLFIGADYPFANLSFYLNPAGDGTVTYVYKYSTAGGIAAGSLSNVVERDFGLYSGFANTGQTSVVFTRPDDWAKNSVMTWLPSKYWLVIEITGITGAPTAPPIQDDKPVYSTTWPFWEIDETEVGGDIEALLRFLLIQIETLDGAGDSKGEYNHILLGSRSYDRGSDFMPYLNVQANNAGMAFAATAPATTPDNSLAPCGKSLNITTVGALAEQIIGTWTLTGSSFTAQYKGRYRVFVRSLITTGTAGEIGFRVQFIDSLGSPATVITQTDLYYTSTTVLPGYELTDLGVLSFNNRGGLPYTQLDISLCAMSSGAVEFDVLDLIIFPVDESNIESFVVGNGKFDYQSGATTPGYQPFHDSTKPKEGPYSAVVDSNGDLIYPMVKRTLKFTIPQRKRTRIYFLPWNDADGELKGTESVFDAMWYRVLQFRNMRGGS